MNMSGARAAAIDPGTVGSPKIAESAGPEVMLELKIVPGGSVAAWIAVALFCMQVTALGIAVAAVRVDESGLHLVNTRDEITWVHHCVVRCLHRLGFHLQLR